MHILGINAFHADAAACIIRDGQLVAAAEEERFTRIKHWAGCPIQAVDYCLQEARIALTDVDHIAINRDPQAHLADKALYTFLKRPNWSAVRDRLRNAGKVRDIKAALCEAKGIKADAVRAEVHHIEHHRAHLGSTFFVSGYEEAAVASIDGFGDFVSTMVAEGKGTSLKALQSVLFPHSLGLFYLALTQYLGFPCYGDEYKVMGLAARTVLKSSGVECRPARHAICHAGPGLCSLTGTAWRLRIFKFNISTPHEKARAK